MYIFVKNNNNNMCIYMCMCACKYYCILYIIVYVRTGVNEIEPYLSCFTCLVLRCEYKYVHACVQMLLSKWHVFVVVLFLFCEMFLKLFCFYSVSMCACMRACNEIVIYLFCCYSVCEYTCVHARMQRLWCEWNCNITVFVASSICKM